MRMEKEIIFNGNRRGFGVLASGHLFLLFSFVTTVRFFLCLERKSKIETENDSDINEIFTKVDIWLLSTVNRVGTRI